MAEKRANTKHNGDLRTVGMILQPFLIYYIVHFVTLAMLTYLVTRIAQKAGGELEALYTERQATVSAIISGLAMLAGILPLLSDFRREIDGDNNCDYTYDYAKKKIDSRRNGEQSLFYKLLLTVMLAFTSSIAINILFLSLQLTENSESYSQVAEHQYSVFFPIGLFLYGIVSPLAEETVFRGILYNRMKKIFSVVCSIVLSALLFGLYHGNIVQALYGFLMGMLIAYTYEMCGGFLYAFLFHAVANAAVYIITGSPALYERFITPLNGIVFAVVSAVLLFFLNKFIYNSEK
ncbi:MAG: CPBP family intramembrane metalloprotease [Lachnospiraceae bacterium]|nr:CPBP family intramembrane metalloprotease [Lachnospiraceae bacterium]